MSQRVIYMDNAATSWPKPPEVVAAMVNFMECVGGNPGRSGHRLSVRGAQIIYEAREMAARLFNAPSPERVIFTRNATEGLNYALHGLLRPGDHVITSSLEHNSVMRPLRTLARRGVELTVVPCSPAGELDPEDVEAAVRPSTRVVVLTHASNVVGTLLPIKEVGEITRRRGVYLVVDAAQTAGSVPIDMQAMGIDVLVFTGHKGLFGPQGTGGLCLGEEVELEPLEQGGTGSQSELEEQPAFLPDRLESGTPNTVGIAGLGAGLAFVLKLGVETLEAHERQLLEYFLAGLDGLPGITVYGHRRLEERVPVVSLNVAGLVCSQVSSVLDQEFGIMTRPGLHCAPSAHRTVGTFPQGTVRFSFGYFTTREEVDVALEALRALAEEAQGE